MVFTIMGEKRSFYKDGTHNISIDVDKANVMWEEPASLLIGQPLTELQLNAQCPDKIGFFVYDPGIGTMLPAGEHTLRVQFYRDPRTRSVVMDFMDSDENEVVEEEADAASVTRLFQPTAKSVTIRVEKRAPEIVWEPLHSLCAGEALTEFHLNARCSASDVAGKFQYSPLLGHIFQVRRPCRAGHDISVAKRACILCITSLLCLICDSQWKVSVAVVFPLVFGLSVYTKIPC